MHFCPPYMEIFGLSFLKVFLFFPPKEYCCHFVITIFSKCLSRKEIASRTYLIEICNISHIPFVRNYSPHYLHLNNQRKLVLAKPLISCRRFKEDANLKKGKCQMSPSTNPLRSSCEVKLQFLKQLQILTNIILFMCKHLQLKSHFYIREIWQLCSIGEEIQKTFIAWFSLIYFILHHWELTELVGYVMSFLQLFDLQRKEGFLTQVQTKNK